ncbi:terminase small subunit [Gemmobacter serpentinus]|uniref:terminase small subunit n=1 Tax=Gemmobacter serpentinus TaxID=2652247 RepID=UPI0018657AF1|nr:terminase small subunit [Gemmobacter serpentinus]
MYDDLDDLLGGSGPQKPDSALPLELDERGMAALTRLSLPQVRTKAREGLFVRSGRGRYDVAESIGRYIEQLRSVASRSGGRPAAGGDTDDLRAEKLRLTRAQADKEEARVARERGELVPADAVSREWAGILRDLRNALLAVPSRCGAGLPHLTSTDIATLDREIRTALEGVAHGN